MKCFVAMPFAFPDTDRLFEEVICAVLKTLDIEPVRVDRIEHNDDIDERIIREIKTADFAIADLTYARPSVYYEAGFAERAIPVIYTSRRDHLAPRADDAMGNHRLHFDLQMKNVIDWADPDDAVFSSRLAGQVRSVISPLLRDAEADSRERAEKAAFQSLSVDSRIQVLSKSAERILAELDFTAASAAKTKFGQQFIRWQPQIEICDVYFVMLKDGVMRFLEISFHKDLAKTPYHFCDGEPRYNLNFGRSLKNLTRIYERKIECALFEIPFQKVCHRMSGFFADPSRKLLAIEAPIKIPALDPASVGDVYLDHHYFWDDIFSGSKRHDGFETQSVPAGVTSRNGLSDNYRFVYGNVPRRSIERRVEYQLIDAIESETQFARRLRAEAAAFAA